MQIPSLVQLALTGLLATSTVSGFQVQPASGAAVARRYAVSNRNNSPPSPSQACEDRKN